MNYTQAIHQCLQLINNLKNVIYDISIPVIQGSPVTILNVWFTHNWPQREGWSLIQNYGSRVLYFGRLSIMFKETITCI